MICWICDHTRFDKISNKIIKGKLGVVSIKDKIREARLRWFRHIRRRSVDTQVRRCEKLDRSDLKQSRGRSRKCWSKVIRHDMKALGLVEDMVRDRRLWRSRIKVANSK
uniref:Uncharacterized protein n=1 Tax=Opuntia streptacantha TaxID=393608 RepID=A0A7C8ZR67_OPUST